MNFQCELIHLHVISVDKNSFKYVQSVILNSLGMKTNKLVFFHPHWLHHLTTLLYMWVELYLAKESLFKCDSSVTFKCANKGALHASVMPCI